MRHKLVNAERLRIFSVLLSVARTCYRRDICPWRYVSAAVGGGVPDIFESEYLPPESSWPHLALAAA